MENNTETKEKEPCFQSDAVYRFGIQFNGKEEKKKKKNYNNQIYLYKCYIDYQLDYQEKILLKEKN